MELVILNQTYTEWLWQKPITKEVDKDIFTNPSQHHLFHGDIYDDITEELITPSPFRTKKDIPCILDYKGSTHGRSKDKLFYRCIPDNKTLPQFLVAYQPKTTGFDKNKVNKYVLIQFKEWSADEKHPIGTLTNTIGDGDNYDAYSEYQLYSKGLVISLKEFIKETLFLKNKKVQDDLIDAICEQYPTIENRTHLNIFSIDPEGCVDIDDAIGIVEHKDHTVISIYIANVPLILDHFNLWPHLSDVCSTIYLPTHKRPMLPSILSDNMCSLLEDELRFAFVMDVMHSSSGLLSLPTFKPVLIKVSKNYVYEEADLLGNTDYQQLLKLTQSVDNKIIDSHDLVEHYMIYMNSQSALKLSEYNCGIFRSAHIKEKEEEKEEEKEKLNSLPSAITTFITNWKYASGQYCTFDTKSSHDLVGKGVYVYTHITSPIRRLVDVINMALLQDKLGLVKYKNISVKQFSVWTSESKVDFINTTMKNIKKVQNNCNLLALYIKNKESRKKQSFTGYIVDVSKKTYHTYNVYVPEYKMMSTFKSNELMEPYSSRQFTLHLFMDEANLKQKIRLQLV